MRAVYKLPGCPAKIMQVPNDLKTLQKLVGGNIEVVTIDPTENSIFEKTVIIICNEEGKLKGLKPNFYSGAVHDVICGAVVFVGEKGENFGSLDGKDAQTICEQLK